MSQKSFFKLLRVPTALPSTTYLFWTMNQSSRSSIGGIMATPIIDIAKGSTWVVPSWDNIVCLLMNKLMVHKMNYIWNNREKGIISQCFVGQDHDWDYWKHFLRQTARLTPNLCLQREEYMLNSFFWAIHSCWSSPNIVTSIWTHFTIVLAIFFLRTAPISLARTPGNLSRTIDQHELYGRRRIKWDVTMRISS